MCTLERPDEVNAAMRSWFQSVIEAEIALEHGGERRRDVAHEQERAPVSERAKRPGPAANRAHRFRRSRLDTRRRPRQRGVRCVDV